jgi:hypothetical protein
VLLYRSNFSQHLPWIVGCLAVTVLSLGWFFAVAARSSTWPGGSSLPGFTFGVAGGLICLFELLLWPRKKLRAWRLGRVIWWMRAHIWLGLLAVPLLILHTGFRWGGPLAAWLMVLFLIVIVSGVWGLTLQQFLPTRMLEQLPAETIYSQIDHVSALLSREGERLVLATCGPEVTPDGRTVEDPEDVSQIGVRHMVLGAVRTAGLVQGKVLETLTPTAPVAGAELLRGYFRETIQPYLEKGSASGSGLRYRPRSVAIFREIRARVNPAAHVAVEALEGLCEQRRQMDQQARIHFWLHNWLCIHLPLSVALIVLMFIHVWVAVRYW